MTRRGALGGPDPGSALHHREHGSATVLGLAIAAGTLLLVLALSALAGAIAARGAAQSAADLAALAAAQSLAQAELRGVGPAEGVREACASRPRRPGGTRHTSSPAEGSASG